VAKKIAVGALFAMRVDGRTLLLPMLPRSSRKSNDVAHDFEDQRKHQPIDEKNTVAANATTFVERKSNDAAEDFEDQRKHQPIASSLSHLLTTSGILYRHGRRLGRNDLA
jgi:hypothetical protein